MSEGGRQKDNNDNINHSKIEINGISNKLLTHEAIYLRKRLLKNIIPKNEIDVSEATESGYKLIETNYHGIKVRGEYYEAIDPGDCLRIYIQGHGGDPNDFTYHNELREVFINNGCDLLSLSMLGRGFNKGAASYPTRFGKLELTSAQANNHGN